MAQDRNYVSRRIHVFCMLRLRFDGDRRESYRLQSQKYSASVFYRCQRKWQKMVAFRTVYKGKMETVSGLPALSSDVSDSSRHEESLLHVPAIDSTPASLTTVTVWALSSQSKQIFLPLSYVLSGVWSREAKKQLINGSSLPLMVSIIKLNKFLSLELVWAKWFVIYMKCNSHWRLFLSPSFFSTLKMERDNLSSS